MSSSSSPHQLLPPFNSTEDGSLDRDPQNLFCPSVLLFLEQLSKVARGSSCKHTNLPLKSRPWGNSGTLLINSESHQRACSLTLCGGMSLHFQAHICLQAGMLGALICLYPLHRQIRENQKGLASSGLACSLTSRPRVFRRQPLH